MDIIKTFREIALERISKTEGKDLEISCNLTTSSQFGLIVESYAHSVLGSTYTSDEKDLYLRITKGYNANYTSDVVKIGMTPEFASRQVGPDGS